MPAVFISAEASFTAGGYLGITKFIRLSLQSLALGAAAWLAVGQHISAGAIFAASFIPTFVIYGILCRRYALNTLLVWGTVIAVPQMVPLLFIHSVTGALIAAMPIGLMGGIATGAWVDPCTQR